MGENYENPRGGARFRRKPPEKSLFKEGLGVAGLRNWEMFLGKKKHTYVKANVHSARLKKKRDPREKEKGGPDRI